MLVSRPDILVHLSILQVVGGVYVNSLGPAEPIGMVGICSNQLFWVKYDGEKWSSFFYFEILLAPSELLLPSAKKAARKGWIGLAG